MMGYIVLAYALGIVVGVFLSVVIYTVYKKGGR